ncbi:hypothetical protein GUJ93_ZPchr0001g30024 [Zizania palustris]|uniref:Uncharacterized protein n=1 Tax=Zizania palustris TaxID=103762 RepID=A0A8J5VAG5_ZIZPA|nr:hypothetical protein GUJ93_ZPchr0001g30024 [Zizania palustris]
MTATGWPSRGQQQALGRRRRAEGGSVGSRGGDGRRVTAQSPCAAVIGSGCGGDGLGSIAATCSGCHGGGLGSTVAMVEGRQRGLRVQRRWAPGAAAMGSGCDGDGLLGATATGSGCRGDGLGSTAAMSGGRSHGLLVRQRRARECGGDERARECPPLIKYVFTTTNSKKYFYLVKSYITNK